MDSRGYRFGIGAALAALIVVCVGLGLYIGAGGWGGSLPKDGGTSQRGQADQKIAAPANKAPLPEDPTGKADNPPCKQGDDKRYSDLCAQWKAADAANESATWTRRAGYIAFSGAVVAALTLLAAIAAALFARQAARHTETGANAAKDAIRPWIDIVMKPKSFATSEDRCTVWFDLVLKNIGHSPARNVRIELEPATPVAPSQGLVQNEELARWLQGRFRGAILPESEYLAPECLSFQWGEGTEIDPLTGFNPWLVINVTYDLPTGERGQTTRSFRIGYPSSNPLADLGRISITGGGGELIAKPFEFGEVR